MHTYNFAVVRRPLKQMTAEQGITSPPAIWSLCLSFKEKDARMAKAVESSRQRITLFEAKGQR